MEISSDEETCCKPVEVYIKTEEYNGNNENETALSEMSKKKYNNAYDVFTEWQKSQNTTSFTEDVLLHYFENLATKSKPPTLWANFSMLRSTINIYNNIDIRAYKKLIAFLKKQSLGYMKETTKLFSQSEIERFLTEAPDEKYLVTKVACIFGVTGACRRRELVNLTASDVEIHGKLVLVKIKESVARKARSFIVPENYYHIVKRYKDRRPPNISTERFFLKIQNGRCTHQVIGINKFGSYPKQIAEYLNLPDPHLYTGHCFRQTSLRLRSSSKYNADWKSTPVAEESEDECDEIMNVEGEIGKLITDSMQIPFSPSTTSFETEISSPKRKRTDDEMQSEAKRISNGINVPTYSKEEPSSTQFEWSSVENVHLHFHNCTNHITINVHKR